MGLVAESGVYWMSVPELEEAGETSGKKRENWGEQGHLGKRQRLRSPASRETLRSCGPRGLAGAPQPRAMQRGEVGTGPPGATEPRSLSAHTSAPSRLDTGAAGRLPAASSGAADGPGPVASSPGRGTVGNTGIAPHPRVRRDTTTLPVQGSPIAPPGPAGPGAYLCGWASSPPRGRRGRPPPEPPRRAGCPCSLERASNNPHTSPRRGRARKVAWPGGHSWPGRDPQTRAGGELAVEAAGSPRAGTPIRRRWGDALCPPQPGLG